MTPAMIAAGVTAFELWDDLIAISLTEGNGAQYDITFAYASVTSDGGTYADIVSISGSASPFQLQEVHIWLNALWDSHDDDADVNAGTYGLLTYIHEIGHALGLSHPGSYNADPNYTPTFNNDAEYYQDTHQWTVMSYFDAAENGSGVDHFGSDGIWKYPSTPMLHDVAAIQAIYGADLTTRLGDTVYGFNFTADKSVFNFNINFDPIICIWDAGGSDTLDVSGYSTIQTISLVPGSYSNIGYMTQNVAIAFGCWIENAFGGSGADTVLGNELANYLCGNGGNDILHGGAGVDSLSGGDNFDVLYGGGDGDFLAGEGGDDELIGGEGGDTYSVGLGQGYDIIFDNAASVGDVLALYTGGYTTLDLRWFTAVGDDLLIRIPQAGGAYALHLLVQGMGSSTGQIETLEFRPGEGSVAIATLNLVQDIWNKVASPGSILFSDAFNRTDGEPANGWSQLTDNAGGGALLIEDGRLTTNGSPAMMGVYRPLELEGPVTISATLTHCSGYGGIPYRYVTQFLFGSDGTTTSGFGLQIYRGDINYANSSIILIHNGVNLAVSFSTFQFEEAIDVQFTLHDDLSISGVVTDGLNSFSFYFDPVDIQLTGSNLAVIATDAGTGINSTIDNLVISEGTANVSLVGADVSETLAGRYGDDVVSGAGGDDTLIGGAGNDLLLGGNGADTFLFNAGLFGADTVTDFANGTDLIQFSGMAGVDDFTDLAISANGSGYAVITLPDGSTITLNNVAVGLVDASDFVFGP